MVVIPGVLLCTPIRCMPDSGAAWTGPTSAEYMYPYHPPFLCAMLLFIHLCILV